MATKKGTTRKSSTKAATKGKKKSLEKVEKKQSNQDTPKGTHGGKREGAGRKPLDERERVNTLREQAELHALAEVAVDGNLGGKPQKLKGTRSEILLNILFDEGVMHRNMTAIKEYLDRTRGKARQPVEHTGEIKTEDQYIPNDPAIEAARDAYLKTQKKLIASGYHVGDYN